MDKMIEILKIKRLSDNKIFEIGDPVESDGFFRGVIDAFCQFEDDFRVHLESDDDRDREYFSITELN